jgi:hypothetical protein
LWDFNYDEELPNLAKQEWGVVFLDHSPGQRRAQDALLFRDTAKYIVVHDWSGKEVREGFTDEVLDHWTSQHVVDKYSPSSLVLSDPPVWWD